MKLTELFVRGKPMLSFEVFPPKTDDKYDSVKHATEEIAKLCPAYKSVTYGAGCSTSDYTLSVASNKDNYGARSLAHFTRVSSGSNKVEMQLAKMKEFGMNNLSCIIGKNEGGAL